MKRSLTGFSAGLFLTLSTLTLFSCSTPPQTRIANEANPKNEIDRTEYLIQEARHNQYDVLAQKNFGRAIAYHSSALNRLHKDGDRAKILRDISVADYALMETNRIGSSYAPAVRPALNARKFAIEAQAQKFEEKTFEDADQDFADMSEDMEAGKFQLDAKKLSNLEKKYNEAELASRKHALLNETKQWIGQAEKNGAKSKTPSLYEEAKAKLAAAENSIAVTPRNPQAYTPSVAAASQAAHKLSEVLAIVIKNDSSEIVAYELWMQQHKLQASEEARSKEANEAKNTLNRANSEANNEKTALQSEIEQKQIIVESQQRSLSSLQSQNTQYANEEELKAKIEELKKTFSSDEAEVLKDGNRLIVRLKKMEFATGRAELNPNSMDTLKKVENLIAAVPATQIVVEGHTDSTGSDRMNNSLSEKRAETVKKYLASQGLEDDMKINVMGFGSNKPLSSNKTKAGRAANRRVDIVIETPAVL